MKKVHSIEKIFLVSLLVVTQRLSQLLFPVEDEKKSLIKLRK